MSIVFITIPGESQQAFAKSLNRRTNGKVDLVIIQKRRKLSVGYRLQRLYKTVGFLRMFRELWYATLLRLDKKAPLTLEYFRNHTKRREEDADLPKIIEVESVNNAEVYALLQKLSPDLLVVWGCKILKPHIIGTTKKAINLHMGYCPHYRGAIANQFAVFDKRLDLVGATIHHLDQKVDTGDIIEVITADISKGPMDLFRDLNDRAYDRFLEIAGRLHEGETLPVTRQAKANGNDTLLKHWTPEIRYKLSRHILAWKKEKPQ